MYLIDHNDPVWEKKVRRINGAFTYSKDLVKYQVPKWENILTDEVIMSTCPKFCDIEYTGDKKEFKLAIQYLHSYPYLRPLERIQQIKQNLPFKTKNIIFISAYREFAHWLNTYRMKTIYCPMGIDVDEIRKFQKPKIHDNRIIYFGNVVQNKSLVFHKIKKECQAARLKFDFISNGKFNDITKVTQEEALGIISQYNYGIGVGRCAQELMALGVKILIAGHKFGGMITTEAEGAHQLGTNMNGRLITYSQNISRCIQNLDKAILVTNDIKTQDHTKDIDASKIELS